MIATQRQISLDFYQKKKNDLGVVLMYVSVFHLVDVVSWISE